MMESISSTGRNESRISGAARALPFAGTLAIIIAFALTGTPPFSVFTSEIMVLIAGFSGGNYMAGAVLLVALAAAFGSLIFYFSKISFGKMPDGVQTGNESKGMIASLVFLVAIMIVFGIAMPPFFEKILSSAAAVLW